MTHVYELRADNGEGYYSLGVFATLAEIRALCTSHDGSDETAHGGPLYEYGDDGEELTAYRHTFGEHSRDGSSGTLVATLKRDWICPDDEGDDAAADAGRVWTTEWIQHEATLNLGGLVTTTKGFDMSIAQEQADIQRALAKRLLTSLFGWGDGIGSDALNRAVDCIIRAAILEVSAIHEVHERSHMKLRKYLTPGPWPLLSSCDRKDREAGDNYGHAECPFCDSLLVKEGEDFSVGDKCCRCGSEITGYEDTVTKLPNEAN